MKLCCTASASAHTAALAVILLLASAATSPVEAFAAATSSTGSVPAAAAAWGRWQQTATDTALLPPRRHRYQPPPPHYALQNNHDNDSRRRRHGHQHRARRGASALFVLTSPDMSARSTSGGGGPSAADDDDAVARSIPGLPVRDGDTGLYALTTPGEHAALMEYAADKLVILKVYAPWCRACKGLEPKFLAASRDPEYNRNAPIVWASLSIQHNKAFVQSIGVLALPTIQFYVGGKLLDTFPCGPSKVPILKKKLSALLLDHVQPDGTLKPASIEQAAVAAEQAADLVKEAAAAQRERDAAHVESSKAPDDTSGNNDSAAAAVLTAAERATLRATIPYFAALSLADLDAVLDQAVRLTFQPGSILVREGKPGRTFYVIVAGEVEICQQTFYVEADPLVQPGNSGRVTDSTGYLGTVVNRLGPGDYFGERALITGEPRAASLRVADEPVTLWALDRDVFPHSCVLSGKSKHTAGNTALDQAVNDKYGLNLLSNYQQQVLDKQVKESATANQVRGSVYTPAPLADDADGDDDDADAVVDGIDLNEYHLPVVTEEADAAASTTAAAGNRGNNDMVFVRQPDDDAIFSLLTRFQMIRHVSTCFKYIRETRAVWGDPGSRTRRNILVQRLSPSQRTEFDEIFHLMDVNRDGCIELSELQRLLESIGEQADESMLENNSGGSDCQPAPALPHAAAGGAAIAPDDCVGPGVMTYEDYMGIMAEAEFYHLFRDIFASLDEQKSGYVRARDLDRVLCGVRDLISDDHKSVIDVDDKDMLIDYEQFSRMLLGMSRR